MTTLLKLKNEAVRQGYKLRHTSRIAGRVSSYYLTRGGETLRISDHRLGQNAYGQDQGGWVSKDVILDDVPCGEDFKHALRDEEYFDAYCSGIPFDEYEPGAGSINAPNVDDILASLAIVLG